ncbi:unnamed protein product, partial [Sphacelaria rigidula]
TGVLRKVDEVSEVDIPATDNNGGEDGARLLREAINSATNDRGTIFMAAISSGNPSIVQLVEECITAVYASDPAQVWELLGATSSHNRICPLTYAALTPVSITRDTSLS